MRCFELYEWAMVLFPILNIYLTPISGISIGEIIILLFGVLIIAKRGKLRINKRLAFFYSYVLVSTAFLTIPYLGRITQTGISSSLSYALYAVILLIYFNTGRVETFCVKYLSAARAVCILTLIQFVLMKTGVWVPLILPGIKNIAGRTLPQLLRFQAMSGPFTEPAHFGQYVSVGLILALVRKRICVKDVILFAASMALTMKGTAAVQLAVIFGFFFLRYLHSKNARMVGRVLFLALGGLAVVAILYFSVDAVRVMFSRVYEITGYGDRSLTGYHGVSGYFRVKYGFDFFHSLDPVHKLFGIGVGSFGQYDRLSIVPKRILYLAETHALEDWRSGFTLILIDSGLIGAAAYLYAVFKGRTSNQAFFAISLIVLQCMSGDMNIPSWVILMYLAFHYSDATPAERKGMTI